MRRLAIVIAVMSAALALQTSVALAGSMTFTLNGTPYQKAPESEDWYLRNAAGQVAGLASFFCLRQNANCGWIFTFRSGSFEIAVPHREVGAKVRLTAHIIGAKGAYAHDKGVVDIYFATPDAASFTFHLTR